MSAYVARALEQRVKLDELDALLSEMVDATGGPVTEPERAEIDREAGWSAD